MCVAGNGVNVVTDDDNDDGAVVDDDDDMRTWPSATDSTVDCTLIRYGKRKRQQTEEGPDASIGKRMSTGTRVAGTEDVAFSGSWGSLALISYNSYCRFGANL